MEGRFEAMADDQTPVRDDPTLATGTRIEVSVVG